MKEKRSGGIGMKVWIDKNELDWLKEMQDEARTRQVWISSFRRFKDDREIEVEII